MTYLDNQNTLICFGDSTTAERIVDGHNLLVYSRILTDKFHADQPSSRVINAGVPGDTTTRALLRLEQDVLARRPQIVVIQFGINDSWIDSADDKDPPRVPLPVYRENLVRILSRLASIQARIILMTPNALGNAIDCWRKANLADYADCVRQTAYGGSVSMIDIWTRFTEYGSITGQTVDQLLIDGMHPNEQGHRLIAEALLPAL